MIHERADGQPVCYVLDAADVITVVVRDDEIVDPRDARLLRRGGDSIGVTVSRIACVDQQRLSHWRDEERRLSTFDVDEVNVEGLPVLSACCRSRKDESCPKQHRPLTHGELPSA